MTLEDIKIAIPVTDMSISELEQELEMISMAYAIFGGAASDIAGHMGMPGVETAMMASVKRFADRIKDIENEIFERNVLVQS